MNPRKPRLVWVGEHWQGVYNATIALALDATAHHQMLGCPTGWYRYGACPCARCAQDPATVCAVSI